AVFHKMNGAMNQNRIRADISHFVEPDRINPVTPDDRIDEEIYSTALDHLVIVCVDVALTFQDQVLLVKRDRNPRPSWWIVGGRMVAGEAPKAAAARKIEQEVQIANIAGDRLRFVGVYSTCFATRHQAPQHHGSHTLNLTYQVELSQAEKLNIELDPDEHTHWVWVKQQDVKTLLGHDPVMDDALLQVIQDLHN
ncbi:MAG TPA: NUDIX domain-containing protein, partial [Allocoleopsis sp.]